MEKLINLDIECAKLGRELASLDIKEKELNDALNVLEEQGIYAMFLYIQAKYKSNVKNDFQKHCKGFLEHILGKNNQTNDKNDKDHNDKDHKDHDDKREDHDDKRVLEFIKQLAENLDELLFAWDLLRRALSYALYHLKAKEG
ncbi:hypothetical protein [Pseudothermotoga sp.]|uniref:hypothetical protein n=1 Tax=Pseudothermotoga sp. TaxID=2033661 RepID=UPI0031F625EB